MTSHCAWNTFFLLELNRECDEIVQFIILYLIVFGVHLPYPATTGVLSKSRWHWQNSEILYKQNQGQFTHHHIETAHWIELQKFCSICLTLTDCISSFPVQCLLLQIVGFSLHSLASNCLSKLNYSLHFKPFPGYLTLSVLLAFSAWLLIPYISFTVTSPSKMALPSGEAPFFMTTDRRVLFPITCPLISTHYTPQLPSPSLAPVSGLSSKNTHWLLI